MKNKKIFLVLLLCMLLFPIKAYAAKIKSVSFGEIDTIKTGDTFNIPVTIDFFGVDSISSDSFGIGGLVFDIDYNHDDLTFIKAETKGFNTTYDSKNNLIESVISTNIESSLTCTDSILFCGTYEAVLTFYVNEIDKTNTVIKINDIVINGYQLKDGVVSSYDKNNLEKLNDKPEKSQTLKIEKGSTIKEKPKVETSASTTNHEASIVDVATKKKETIIKNGGITSDKSDNNYLKNITIKGYNIDFYKKTFDYDITIEEGINNLVIDASLDDEKALLEIVGADNLKANNNQVLIKVTAENGDINTYTINVKRITNDNETKLTSSQIMDNIKDIYNNHKVLIIAGAILLVIIIVVAIIINKVNDNKLKKNFDNL